MKNVSFSWTSIFKQIEMYTTDGQNVVFPERLVAWRLFPIYPSCQSLDVAEFIDFEKFQPKQLQFQFYKIKNIGISLHIQERNKESL